MVVHGKVSFLEMAREFPVRTGVFTLLPVLFALAQIANSLVHGGSVLYTVWFSVALVGYSVTVNRYHLAAFRRAKLSSALGQ